MEGTVMTETTDIIIIGGGVIGTSIAYHLARRGEGQILLLERQAICNGTTGRSGAIVRQHYSNDFSIRMATTSCFASRARDYGATIREGEPVTHILTQNNHVQGVRTRRGEIYAPVVVLAANVWSVALARGIGIDLPIIATRHPMVALRRPNDFGGRSGLHAVGLDLTRDIYFRPDSGGITLVGPSENLLSTSNPHD